MTSLEPRIPSSVPSGTRDLLPDELQELRGITRAIEDCFTAAGYGEVRTPTLELESSHNADLAAYRFIDELGNALVLRADMTIPIARVALTRFGKESFPLRLSYLERSWRRTKAHSGEGREILQAGAELIGGGDSGVIEVVELCAKALAAAGLHDWKIAVGDARILDSVVKSVGVDDVSEFTKAVAEQDLVTVDRLAQKNKAPELSEVIRYRRSASHFLSDTNPLESSSDAADNLRNLLGGLTAETRERLIVDFSLTSPLDYYSGIVFSIYEPSVGRAVGGGGSYDALLADAQSDLSGCGFALDVDLLHQALAGEERGEALPSV